MTTADAAKAKIEKNFIVAGFKKESVGQGK